MVNSIAPLPALSHFSRTNALVERQARPQTAFTLVELLVVVAIISLLVTILMPSLSRAMDLAKKAVCHQTLRNIGLATSLYEAENSQQLMILFDKSRNDGRFAWLEDDVANPEPERNSHSWADLLLDERYLDEGSLLCPTVKDRSLKISYGMNMWSMLQIEDDGKLFVEVGEWAIDSNKLEDLSKPEGRIVFADAGIFYNNSGYWYGGEFPAGALSRVMVYNNMTRYAHNDETECSMLFADKHIGSVPYTEPSLHNGPFSPGKSNLGGWYMGDDDLPLLGY